MTLSLKKTFIGSFILIIAGIAAFFLFQVSFSSKRKTEYPQARIIIPITQSAYSDDENPAEQIARMELMTVKAPLGDGEILAALLNGDFDGDLYEEQFVAYRNLLEAESPIYLSYIDYDQSTRQYNRVWTAATAASRPGTISLYTQDLIGDRGSCVLLAGMNGLGEHTLTVFRKTQPAEIARGEAPFRKIAEIRIDGSIVVREVERSQAYQLGMASGQSFSISAYGRDNNSSNLMDQIEISYVYNENTGLYEQNRITRIPGTQIEQARLRELLGNARAFEEFVTGLWYYSSPQGSLDSRQFIYFDPLSKEIIFYEDDTQQVFSWQTSYSTRYGLYVNSQNISVSTLRRAIDIELESLESIKVKVFEDVRLNIGVNASWDGSYRKAAPESRIIGDPAPQNPYINAVYDSSLGKIRFYPDGNFEISQGGNIRQGKYAFFYLDDDELLELRSMEYRMAGVQVSIGPREIYLVESAIFTIPEDAEDTPAEQPQNAGMQSNYLQNPPSILNLSSIRLGARGIQRLHEGIITLTLAN